MGEIYVWLGGQSIHLCPTNPRALPQWPSTGSCARQYSDVGDSPTQTLLLQTIGTLPVLG